MTRETVGCAVNAVDLAKRACEWVASPIGKEAITKVIANAEHAQFQLQQSRQVDPDSLNKPVTL